jgi:hypothetical protein
MARKGTTKNNYKNWFENLLEGDCFEDPRVDIKITDLKGFGWKT